MWDNDPALLHQTVENLRLHLEREQALQRRIESTLIDREEKLAEVHREVMKAEARVGYDDLAQGGRHLHRASVDKLRVTEAAHRTLLEEESAMLELHRRRSTAHHARVQGLRERAQEASERAAEVDCMVKMQLGVAADLREFGIEQHKNYRDRVGELARWHVEHRQRALEDIMTRQTALEASLSEETRAMADHLESVVTHKRHVLADLAAEIQRFDAMLDDAGRAIETHKSNADAIAEHQVSKASLRGELEALTSHMRAIEETIVRSEWRMDEKVGQVEHATEAHGTIQKERVADDRLEALLASVATMKAKRLELHRRTMQLVDSRRGQLGDSVDEEALRHSLQVLNDERQRYAAQRREKADAVEALEAENRRLGLELQAALEQADVLQVEESHAQVAVEEERRRLETATEETMRRTQALLQDLQR